MTPRWIWGTGDSKMTRSHLMNDLQPLVVVLLITPALFLICVKISMKKANSVAPALVCYIMTSTSCAAHMLYIKFLSLSAVLLKLHILCCPLYCDRYKMSLLKPSTKALALSCKVSVRTDSRGFLSLQYLVRNDDGQICFVEYYCCPDEEVEEE